MSNLVQKAYKLRFYPQNDLKIILAKTFGCTRFVYNQTLDYSENHYAQKEILVSQGIDYKNLTNSDRINFIKTLKDSIELDPLKPNYNQLKYPWLKEVSSISLQQSIRHLNDSYSRFFKGQSAKPQFKSKRDNHNSFTITGKNSLHFDKDFNKPDKPGFKKFYLPKYDKPLNIKFGKKDNTRFNHLAVSSVTISQNPTGQYFISFLAEEDLTIIQAKNSKCAFDLGLKTMAKVYEGKVDSQGNKIFQDFNLPDLLKAIDKKLRKQQRILSRKGNGSKNRNKQRLKVAKTNQKRVNIITDYYQKQSTIMVNENQEIVLEDLNISGMKKNRKLSRAIHNIAWNRFISMIKYKSKWHKRKLTVVNRFYPSSKTCSSCGHIYKELSLKERQWTCVACNANHDRDENACLNLFSFINNNAVGTTVNACGGNVRPKRIKKVISKSLEAVSSEAGIHCL